MGIHPVLRVVFFRSQGGREPVRDWLLDLSRGDRKAMAATLRLLNTAGLLECL
jgi:hypothetical protein